MKSSAQMNAAKHMIAIWMNPRNPLLEYAFDTINSCWPMLPRRVLRKWAKELHKNPERYEFTGLAFKKLKLEDHFTTEEIDDITRTVANVAPTHTHHEDLYRTIIIHKWVYGYSAAIAIEGALKLTYSSAYKSDYHGTFIRRPAKPALKP